MSNRSACISFAVGTAIVTQHHHRRQHPTLRHLYHLPRSSCRGACECRCCCNRPRQLCIVLRLPCHRQPRHPRQFLPIIIVTVAPRNRARSTPQRRRARCVRRDTTMLLPLLVLVAVLVVLLPRHWTISRAQRRCASTCRRRLQSFLCSRPLISARRRRCLVRILATRQRKKK